MMFIEKTSDVELPTQITCDNHFTSVANNDIVVRRIVEHLSQSLVWKESVTMCINMIGTGLDISFQDKYMPAYVAEPC